MTVKYELGVLDYCCISMMLLISLAIGFKVQWSSRKSLTTAEYLMAGKNMSVLPVILSVCVTSISSVTMLGTSMEVYKYGTQILLFPLGIAIGLTLYAFICIPVYFQCNVTSIYEYLEMRYGKAIRYTVSILFLIEMVLFQSVVLYGPILALQAVTNLSFELTIIVFGAVCAVYSSVGGLKGVLWTDVFQSTLMLTFILVVFVAGMVEIGGFSNLYIRVQEGGRWIFFNFSIDPTVRYTFWNVLCFGTFASYTYYGTSQVEVQRILSMGSAERAQRATLKGIPLIAGASFFVASIGGVMYAVFYRCDPLSIEADTGLQKHDQVLPYFVASRFAEYPGLTGLCIAGIISGSLSTVSSVVNSLATVTIIDFLQPCFASFGIPETRMVFLAKGLSFFYGLVCIGLCFVVAKSKGLFQIANIFVASIESPIGAVFTAGMLSKKVSQKSAFCGLVCGLIISCWMGYGSLIKGYIQPPLPFPTSGCSPSSSSNFSTFFNTTAETCPNCSVPVSASASIQE